MESKTKNIPGTPLKDEDIKSKKVLTLWWDEKPKYAWDCGVALSKYLWGLKEGKIYGIYCGKCRRVLLPPRMFCEYCFVPTSKWVELEDEGEVLTFSICYVTWDAKRIEKPNIPAVIHIKGASDNVGILHLLSEVAPDDVKIGMKVKAVWRNAESRKGDITDIKYFKPLK